MTENEKARELIATSETTVKVDPQNGWYLKRFAALQFFSVQAKKRSASTAIFI